MRHVMYRPKPSIKAIETREELNKLIKNKDIDEVLVENEEDLEKALDAFFSSDIEDLIGFDKQKFKTARIKERQSLSWSVHFLEEVEEKKPEKQDKQDKKEA